MDQLRYPVGRFQYQPDPGLEQRAEWISQIAEMPAALRAAVAGLTEEQLDTPYRPEGWTVRQVVHHVADSHLNSFIRFRLALTEKEPTIKPYRQDLWAELADSRTAPVGWSLSMIEGLHARWVVLMRTFEPADFARQFLHPEMGPMTLDRTLALYAWHGRHHTAHITSLRDRMGWR